MIGSLKMFNVYIRYKNNSSLIDLKILYAYIIYNTIYIYIYKSYAWGDWVRYFCFNIGVKIR